MDNSMVDIFYPEKELEKIKSEYKKDGDITRCINWEKILLEGITLVKIYDKTKERSIDKLDELIKLDLFYTDGKKYQDFRQLIESFFNFRNLDVCLRLHLNISSNQVNRKLYLIYDSDNISADQLQEKAR